MSDICVTKVCKKCLRDLPAKKFYRQPEMADGRASSCMECVKIMREQAHRAKVGADGRVQLLSIVKRVRNACLLSDGIVYQQVKYKDAAKMPDAERVIDEAGGVSWFIPIRLE